MKVTANALPSVLNGKPFVMCDHGRQSAVGFKLNVTQQIEVVQLPRRANPKIIDWGGRLCSVTFSVKRVFESHLEAAIHMAEVAIGCPGKAWLEIEIVSLTGKKKFYIHEAGIQTIEQSFIGATTIHAYQITGGILSKTKPDLTP